MEMGDLKRIIGLKSHMKCSLCDGVYKDATTINLCLHTFCHTCIHKWVEDEYQHHCPECNIELGPSAVTKLRPDHHLRSLRSALFHDKLEKIKTPEDAPTVSSLVVTALKLPVPTVKESSMDSSTVELSIMPRSMEDLNKEKPRQKAQVFQDNKDPKLFPESVERHRIHAGSRKAVAKTTDHILSASVLVEAEAVRFDSKSCPVWVTLAASEDLKGNALPQISHSYVRFKDPQVPVSIVQKYVCMKLGLTSGEEVEIHYDGQPVSPNLPLNVLRDIWLKSKPKDEKIATFSGDSGDKFLMHLSYCRKKLDLLPTQQHNDSEKKEEKNPLKIRFKIPSSRSPVVPEPRKKRNASPADINKNPKKKHKNSGPDPPPELPEAFRSVIGEGSDAKLVIQKRLYDTDLTDNHNRLSIPLNQVKFEFLMDDEIAYLSTRKEDRKRELQSMEVNIIEPSLKVSKISLKRWDLKKLSNQHQKENSSYVLNGTWKKIKQDNQLKVGDVIQLYAYRIEGKLNFALVKLAEIERDTKEIFGGSSSGIM